MERDAFSKLSDEHFQNEYEKDYQPNPLESYSSFIERKKQASLEESNNQMDNVFKGIMLFSLIEDKNERIQNLMVKYFSLGEVENLNLKGETREEIAKNLLENNLFGLKDDDFEELMKLANYVEKREQFQQAVEMYQAITVLFPQRLEGWLKWANAESRHFFEYQKILSIYNKCLEAFEHPFLNLSTAICHVKGNNFEAAEEQFQKCIDSCDKFNETELKKEAEELLSEVKSFH